MCSLEVLFSAKNEEDFKKKIDDQLPNYCNVRDYHNKTKKEQRTRKETKKYYEEIDCDYEKADVRKCLNFLLAPEVKEKIGQNIFFEYPLNFSQNKKSPDFTLEYPDSNNQRKYTLKGIELSDVVDSELRTETELLRKNRLQQLRELKFKKLLQEFGQLLKRPKTFLREPEYQMKLLKKKIKRNHQENLKRVLDNIQDRIKVKAGKKYELMDANDIVLYLRVESSHFLPLFISKNKGFFQDLKKRIENSSEDMKFRMVILDLQTMQANTEELERIKSYTGNSPNTESVFYIYSENPNKSSLCFLAYKREGEIWGIKDIENL